MVRVFARHYFSSAASQESFPAIIRNLERLALATGWKTEMLATFLPTFPPPEVHTRTVKLSLSVSGKNEGGGIKVWEGFFARSGGMAVLVDGDMQTFGKGEIMVLRHLLERMRGENKAFGCAARTIVRMHPNAALNNLRVAQEAFYLSFGMPPLPDNPLGVLTKLPATYQKLGDIFSGCYAINLDHPAAQQVRAEVAEMRSRGMFNGFALEYYLGMRFAQLGAAASTYLPTRPDHGVTERSAEAVWEMIRKDWAELRQSPIGEALKRHVRDVAVQQRVGELVGERVMGEVLGLFDQHKAQHCSIP